MNEEVNKHNIKIYEKIYSDIIKKAKDKKYDLTGYCEVHHIVPRCCGGNNSNDNLVIVPIRVHIILHLLLARINEENNLLAFAANAMLNKIGKCTKKFSTKIIARFRELHKLALRREGITDKQGNKIFIGKSTVCYDKDFKVIRVYDTCWSSIQDGFYRSSVSRAARGKASIGNPNYYAKYYWAYEEDFKKDHLDKLNIYYNNLKLGIIPELDDSYNKLNTSERLKLRPKVIIPPEIIKKKSEKLKGKFFVSPEKYKEGRIKARETMLKRGILYARSKPVITPAGEFPTLTKAGEYYKVSRKTIVNWLDKEKDGFRYKD